MLTLLLMPSLSYLAMEVNPQPIFLRGCKKIGPEQASLYNLQRAIARGIRSKRRITGGLCVLLTHDPGQIPLATIIISIHV
jgi:hypothetical protein